MKNIFCSFLIVCTSHIAFSQEKSSQEVVANPIEYEKLFINDSLPTDFPQRNSYTSSEVYSEDVRTFIQKNISLILPQYRSAFIKEEDYVTE